MDAYKNKKFLSDPNRKQLLHKLRHMHASDAAESLMMLELPLQVNVFRLFPRKFAVKVFTYMHIKEQEDLLRKLTKKEKQKLLTDMNPDDLTDLLEDVSHDMNQRISALLSPQKMKQVQNLMGYPVDSIWREMTHHYISVQSKWTVKKAMDHIRKNGENKETINIVYIINERGKFLGDIKLKYLIFADEKSLVGEIAKTTIDTTALSAFDDKEKAVQVFKKLNISSLPVVDPEGILLGIVTFDDLVDIEEEEVTEDFHKMWWVSVGHGWDLSLTNIVDASIKLLYKKRIFWLMVLVFVNIFAGGAIALFEDMIAKYIVLLFFLPLLIAGWWNAWSQAAMLMVRALGTGDVKVTDWVKMFFKEFFVAGLLAITMAAGVALIGWFRGWWDIAIIVAISMVAIVMVGSLFGMVLPFIFTKLKKDPATASGPLITSVADICGVLIYFSIAKLWLGI